MAEPKKRTLLSLQHHALAGSLVVLLIFGGLGAWATTTEVAGAVVAGGMVVVEGGSKRVQHQEGGIISEILAHDDDQVVAGGLLLRLDGTAVAANLEIVQSQLREALALQARLTAESTGEPILSVASVAPLWGTDPALARLLDAQDRVRQSRKESLERKLQSYDDEVAQLEHQITAFEAQKAAVMEQLRSVTAEAEDVAGLYKGRLVDANRVNTLKRQEADLTGSAASLDASIAGNRSAMAQRRQSQLLLSSDFQSQVLTDLQEVGQKIAELTQQKIAGEDRLRRLEIRAPISGVVHESVAKTIGGVINPGETLMLIVPQDQPLSVETRVSPLDIDKLTVGQDASIRLTGLDIRSTPELAGKITGISPDLSRDERTGAQFYTVQLALGAADTAKLPAGVRIVPGMPAEVFIRTADRSVLSYLVHPLTAQMERVFRED